MKMDRPGQVLIKPNMPVRWIDTDTESENFCKNKNNENHIYFPKHAKPLIGSSSTG